MIPKKLISCQDYLNFIYFRYSNESLQKIFYSHQILEQYKNNNNKKKAHLKQYIQHLFQQALKHKIIQNNLQIEFKNKKKDAVY